MAGLLLRRLLYTLPILVGVALVCFTLVHLAPGDPLVSILPPDASLELQQRLRELYGFNRSYPVQFAGWLWRALQGDLGTSIASGRPVADEVLRAVGNTLRLAVLATLIGFALGGLFGFVAGYLRGSWMDKAASLTRCWASACRTTGWAWCWSSCSPSSWAGCRPGGAGEGGSTQWAWDWEHVRHLVLPAVTMSVIPMGIIARTVRALVADILSQEFVVGLRARGLTEVGVFRTWSRTRAHRAGGDGPATGLPAGRLDPDRDRVLVAGRRLPAQLGHLPARPAAAAGHHPRAGRVLRPVEPDRRPAANAPGSAHRAQLT
jgi:peptide/nickel transport system permease protein